MTGLLTPFAYQMHYRYNRKDRNLFEIRNTRLASRSSTPYSAVCAGCMTNRQFTYLHFLPPVNKVKKEPMVSLSHSHSFFYASKVWVWFFSFLGWGSHYVVQACFKLLSSDNPLALATEVAETTGVQRCTQ